MAKSVRKMNASEVQLSLEDQIRNRAYELYQQRGAAHGNDLEHWFAAEREFRETPVDQAAAEAGKL